MTVAKRRRVRDAIRLIEDAVVELHALEQRARGKSVHGEPTVQKAEKLFVEAKGEIEQLQQWFRPDERRRAEALLDTVALVLSLRMACGEASILGRLLN